MRKMVTRDGVVVGTYAPHQCGWKMRSGFARLLLVFVLL